ncbi:NAD(P)H-hydrate dehydratase [Chitinilyticum piscinae]|uniref:Bifunctional NAD(P)H-hydrate repair enzyme n=1 Tax=Chitinilyticum piscinae TaxID=2866724 RepID=A0A8J7K103_9NEIS|nr:NAD(P)H-hydrate dehydratase [Chitinilyticum piscinae]MBE9607897.1 NAD(P)H-hydrate dehydratase [Chitinilyticum piscinae]
MKPLLDTRAIRSIEMAALADGVPLMQRAGTQAANWISEHYPHARKILVLAGPGNNGGDALILANVLAQRQIDTMLLVVYPDSNYQSEALQAWQAYTGTRITESNFPESADLVVDGVFGLGLRRPLDPHAQSCLRLAAALGCPVIALDLPSGVNPDTGAVDPATIAATHTLTFLAEKPGLHTGKAKDYCGTITLFDLGITVSDEANAGHLLSPHSITPFLERLQRKHDTHKGSFGCVEVIGGDKGMVGAPLLAARAALYAGAGKIRAHFLAPHAPTVDLLHPELMLSNGLDWHYRPEVTVQTLGPGLGQSEAARRLVADVLRQSPTPLLLDADALNLIAESPDLQTFLLQRPNGTTILTPHPREAARLLNCTVTEVQMDRISTARTLSSHFQSICILKGAGTVIAAPDGRYWLNQSGNAALSCAGQGDLLAGLIGGLLAQHLSPLESALSGVMVHGLAGDLWLQAKNRGLGLISQEILPIFRKILNNR